MTIRRLFRPSHVALALALAATGGAVVAQIDSGAGAAGGGVSPIDSSGSYEVGGVTVDVTGPTADAARYGGWRIAQRKGWQMLSNRLGGGGGLVSDSTLDAMVSGIVVEHEQIGPNRYVARLGILFNRARAGALLGVAGQALRSPPMLVLPVEWSGGAGQVFEQDGDWQQAWARFRTGNSTVDYVRASGGGTDPLLLSAGQVGRPDRGWWRKILDQYGASDVLIPVVRLSRQWPGGPIVGAFEAAHGPDNRLIAKFTLRVANADALPLLLDAGIKRIDEAYQAALRNGTLATDPSLAYIPPPVAVLPQVLQPEAADTGDTAAEGSATDATTAISVQFDTPGADSVASNEAALRGVPGVRSAITTSLALGGVSVMRVGYAGTAEALRSALEARGWTVQVNGATLRIRRAAPRPAATEPAAPSADNATQQ